MSNWQPGASKQTLQLRARLLAAIRGFFSERGVLEVETPLLTSHTVTDVNIESFSVDTLSGERFLQTSPEYAMKRLLAAGSGPIYQICKAFRQEGDDAASRQHNPEFTILEWYRPGYTMNELMDETAELMQHLLGEIDIPRFSYRELFMQNLAIDPHVIDSESLQALTRQKIDLTDTQLDDTDYLQLLMNQIVEPSLPQYAFVYDYPKAQAALAEIADDEQGVKVAKRFELYAGGMELANAYQELTDADSQRARFDKDQELRNQRGLKIPQADEKLLAAMDYGLPACSGIALGIDRLLMLAAKETNIGAVISFDHERS